MLAESALAAIAEHGYAQTGLRDVAQHSGLSHGSLHYYFDDKDDLVALAVWNYKSECARRYDPIVETAADGVEFVQRIGNEMASTMREDASLHRLWYDLRNQALFTPGFRETIIDIDRLLEEMVWAIVSRYAELAGRRPAINQEIAYSLFDGLFQNALIRFLRGDKEAGDRLSMEIGLLLDRTLGDPV
ncbi:TetR/AcrR family transcriptional regulator [Planctomonas sp. JC2975]|nr:TetR/AcrR family transcriptional regulator [Planctomonas sp. JC2975]NNC10719.1 TetR/AcrR family transcriptional regulator [Planctomonas sp. JC2975]